MNNYMQGIMQKPIEKPTHPCWTCGSTDYWLRKNGCDQWLCSWCHPDPAVKKQVAEKQI